MGITAWAESPRAAQAGARSAGVPRTPYKARSAARPSVRRAAWASPHTRHSWPHNKARRAAKDKQDAHERRRVRRRLRRPAVHAVRHRGSGSGEQRRGEGKQEPLDRPSRGRHSRKKKMAPPSMAPPTMKPPSMAPPRDLYSESKDEEKSSGFGSCRRPGRVDAVPGASPREAAPDPDAAAPAGVAGLDHVSGRRAHVERRPHLHARSRAVLRT